jgi:hypothetical protein
MRNNPYTSQEDEIIISMNKAGYKPKDIAQVLLSRQESGIQDRGYNLGLKWTPEPEIDMEAYKKLMKGK